MKYIRDYYKVPAKRGMTIIANGKRGVITSANGPHLMVRIDGAKHSFPYHPTWNMEYIECRHQK